MTPDGLELNSIQGNCRLSFGRSRLNQSNASCKDSVGLTVVHTRTICIIDVVTDYVSKSRQLDVPFNLRRQDREGGLHLIGYTFEVAFAHCKQSAH